MRKQSTSQPISYISQATRVLQKCGITPKKRQEFLSNLSKQLTAQTSTERKKFLDELSQPEIEAWIRAFQFISKYLSDSLDHSSSESERQNESDDNPIRTSPKHSPKPILNRSLSPKGEVTLGNIYAFSSDETEEDNFEEPPQMANANVQTPPRKENKQKLFENSPRFINFDAFPDLDEKSTQTPPASPHSPRDIPSFVNLKKDSSSNEELKTDQKTGLMTVNTDDFIQKPSTAKSPKQQKAAPSSTKPRKLIKKTKKIIKRRKRVSGNKKNDKIATLPKTDIRSRSPEDRPILNTMTIDVRKASDPPPNPPSPRLLELAKPRNPKLPIKESSSDDFIVDEVFSGSDY